MVKQAANERRREKRAKRILSIQYRIYKSEKKYKDKTWGLSTTQDMSAEGLSFYLDREYGVNDILEIHIIMSGSLDIYRGFAKIIRIERKDSGSSYLAAVKFVEKANMIKKSYLAMRKVRSIKSKTRL